MPSFCAVRKMVDTVEGKLTSRPLTNSEKVGEWSSASLCRVARFHSSSPSVSASIPFLLASPSIAVLGLSISTHLNPFTPA